MFKEFRRCYPQGNLISELIQIHEGNFIVRILAQEEGKTLISSFGSGQTIETAEDKARLRLFQSLNLAHIASSESTVSPSVNNVESVILNPVSPTDNGVADSHLLHHQEEKKRLELSLNSEEITTTTEEKTAPITVKKSKKAKSSAINLVHQESNLMDNNKPVETTSARVLLLEDEQITPRRKETKIQEVEEKTEILENQGSGLDFGHILTQTDQELKRLGWSSSQGQKYLIETYGKRSRQLLKDEELLEFLHYLQGLSSVVAEDNLVTEETTETVNLIPEAEIISPLPETVNLIPELEVNSPLPETVNLIPELEVNSPLPETVNLIPEAEVNSPLPETEIQPIEEKTEIIENQESGLDFGQILTQTDQELKRLGWSSSQGQKYLIETYGKRSRQLLKDEELLEFLHYLQGLSSVVAEDNLVTEETTETVNLIPELEVSFPVPETKIQEVEEKTEIIENQELGLDFGHILTQTDQELKRLGWSNSQGQKYLVETYGKRSRQLLKDEELLEFLHYLQSLPNAHTEADQNQLNLEVESQVQAIAAETTTQDQRAETLTLNIESPTESTSEVIDFSDLNAKINVEIKRLNWSKQEKGDYILATYGKRSLQLLSDGELVDFLQYLENLPAS